VLYFRFVSFSLAPEYIELCLSLQEVKVQGEHGEIFKFAVDERGNLPFDIVNALCVGTVALKYRTNDQTW
jgi:hypothetical protein